MWNMWHSRVAVEWGYFWIILVSFKQDVGNTVFSSLDSSIFSLFNLCQFKACCINSTVCADTLCYLYVPSCCMEVPLRKYVGRAQSFLKMFMLGMGAFEIIKQHKLHNGIIIYYAAFWITKFKHNTEKTHNQWGKQPP